MFDDLRGRRVLVTGATQGIGWGAVQAYAKAGAHVAFNGRQAPPDLAQRLSDLQAHGGRVVFVAGDLSCSADCEHIVAETVAALGGLDVLVNNAGGLVARKPLPEIDDAFFDAVMDLNARSALVTTRAALPHLKAAAAASGQTSAVILLGSVAGYTGGGPGAGLYGAAKAWLHNIQKNWVMYHTADGIRFNTVSPGTFDTAFHADKSDEVKARIAQSIPMGRFGRPADAAPAFLFLASHACSGYITGQVLDINGGQHMP
ncbi:MAG: SDR family oxidoreductase [Sphaerotilus natans subsp. sulfidivorans]|uniref:SDR family NAD(P)-dependent oxidoreductase n=1 Tax=Sphaerotilus sulfidivorans TaxID=639200 RepID=UPI0023566CE4|nr:SDR family oxidoreductase [Sphaerotilus sulfidivorans]MCK6402036.1 SDR family oxidoreductase [Sphaerotilus sulfidivorans]